MKHALHIFIIVAFLAFPALAGEITLTCPPTLPYTVALDAPADWKASIERNFTAEFADLQLFDDSPEKKQALIPENGDAPLAKKLPLTWKLDGVAAPSLECHYRAADGSPGMGATLARTVPAPVKHCASQPDGKTSGNTLRCVTP